MAPGDILSRINAMRAYLIIPFCALLFFVYGPDEPFVYLRFHKYNAISSYYCMHPMAQNVVLLAFWFLVYLKFEAQIRYFSTRCFWSEDAADEIVALNNARMEQLQRELNRSQLRQVASSSMPTA